MSHENLKALLESTPTTNEEKLAKWQEVKNIFDLLKTAEMDLRKELCAHILGDKIKGNKTAAIGEKKVTATAKLNTSVDKELLRTIWTNLSADERKAIRFKPEVVAKEYGKIPNNSKLHQAVETKPGMPTLVVKA